MLRRGESGNASKQLHDSDGKMTEARGSRAINGKQSKPAEAAKASDPFAFDLSAFGMGSNTGAAEDPYAFNASQSGQQKEEEGVEEEPPSKPPAEADPFAFDLSAFGMGAPPVQEEDPYAFDPASFGEAPASEATEKPQSKREASSDPFAFDPSAFGEAGATAPKPAEDPFAVNMDAFGDSYASQSAPQQPPSQNADPFAFDMSAFEQPGQTQGAAEDSDPKKTAKQASQGCQQHPSASKAIAHDDLGSSEKEKSKRWKQNFFTKEPKILFQPLSVLELAELKEVLLPPLDADSSEEQSSMSESGEEEQMQKGNVLIGGLRRESAEQVLKIATVVAVGLPGSIADATALDNAAQRAACSIQVDSVLGQCQPIIS